MPAIDAGTTAGATFTFGLIPQSSPATNAGAITATCLITKVSYKNPAEEDVEIECSYETTGSFTV